jgi:O-antigen ligase
VLVIAALVALIATGARLRDFRTGLDGPIALLVLAAIVTTVRHPLAGVDEAAPLRFLLTVIVFYYVTVAMVRRQPGTRLALPMIATFAIVSSAVVGVAQVAQGTPTGFYRDGFTPVVSQTVRDDLLPRAIGSFANPNLLATHILLLAPLAVAFALTAVAREVKVTLFGLAALSYLGLVLTFSRAALGAVFISAIVVAYAVRHDWRPRLRLTLAAGAVLVLLGTAITGGDLLGGFGRPEAWKLSFEVWGNNPLNGVGLGRAGDALNAQGGDAISYRHAHNLWLTWLVEAGPLAFAALLWISGWLLWRGWRAASKGRTLAAASLASIVGFFTFSMLDHPANTERIATAFWFVAALIAAGVRPPEGVWLLERLGIGGTSTSRPPRPPREPRAPRPGRRTAMVAVVALLPVLVLAGCGGDDEKEPEQAADTTAQTTTQLTEVTEPTTTDEATTDEGDGGVTAPDDPTATDLTSPEDQQGGAGDEEPIGVDAAFTGSGGKLDPPLVQVPPFIGIRVTLTSSDDQEYELQIGGKTLTAAPGKTATAQLDGLRQGAAYDGLFGRGGKVRIEASAEPGP